MKLEEVFKRVSELTGQFPNLSKEEVKELQKLTRNLSAECADILYDWNNQ
ncbi:hypothetical protein [Viridibacillus arvi]